MSRKKILYFCILLFLLGVLATGPCFTACSGTSPDKIKMRVLCAGSLMVPFDELEKTFEASHPGVDVLTEGHGSIQVIRHVTEIFEESDILAVADDSLIPMMMYTTKIPETDTYFADWYIKFSTNSLGIAFRPESKYAGEINGDNWYEILQRPDIKIGLADARLDACGYYTLMMLSLAEFHYNNDSIFDNVLGTFNPPLKTESDGNSTTITVPEILRPDNEKTVVRASSIRLLALLESGDLDYSFEYESVARQHNLKFISLPPEINLGSTGQAEFYSRVLCKMDFQRFATVQPEFTGQPIFYGITIPLNAPHPETARQYIEFLIGSAGQEIMNRTFQPILAPWADNPDNVPPSLKSLLSNSN